MKIDRKLHLVIPYEREDKSRLFVHCSTISTEVFHTYYVPMAKALSAIYVNGTGMMGARIAHLALRDAAKELKVWEGAAGVERGLIAEIHRLTNVLAPGKSGWDMIPLDEARSTNLLDAREADEVEGAICFFTLGSSLHLQAQAEELMSAAADLWEGRIEYLSCTAFMNSLGTSIPGANTGEIPAAA